MTRIYTYCLFSEMAVLTPYLAILLQNLKDFPLSFTFLFFSVYSISVFLLEIPTGFVTDRIGSRKSLVTGNMLRIVSVAMLMLPNKYFVLLSQFFLALGNSFRSGSDETYYFNYFQTNSQLFADKNMSFEKFISNLSSITWLGVALSFLCGTVFFRLGWTVFIWIAFSFYSVSFCLSILLKKEEVPLYGSYKKIAIYGIREVTSNKSLLIWFLLYGVIMGLIVTSYHNIQILLIATGLAGDNNGLIFFFLTVFSVAGAKLQPVIVKKNRNMAFVFTLVVLATVVFLFSSARGYLLLALLMIFRLIWGFFSPLFSYEINTRIQNSKVRSTVFSLCNMATNAVSGLVLLIFSLTESEVDLSYKVLGFLILFIGFFSVISLKIRKPQETNSSNN